MGLWLLQRQGHSLLTRLQHIKGRFLLWLAPALMRLLTLVGTLAMFLVGGGILLHGIPGAHHLQSLPHLWSQGLPLAGVIASSLELTMTAIFGVLAGTLLVGLFTLYGKLRK